MKFIYRSPLLNILPPPPELLVNMQTLLIRLVDQDELHNLHNCFNPDIKG